MIQDTLECFASEISWIILNRYKIQDPEVGANKKESGHIMIGDMIFELRKDQNLTQKDLANYLRTSVATVSHYENEINYPDIQTLIKIADFFGVSVDYILGRTRLKMDYNMFSRKVRMVDGSEVSAQQVLTSFLQLSDKSQASIVELINLYKLRDHIQHNKIMAPVKKMDSSVHR